MITSLMFLKFPYSIICVIASMVLLDVIVAIRRRASSGIKKLAEVDKKLDQILPVSKCWAYKFKKLVQDSYTKRGTVPDIHVTNYDDRGVFIRLDQHDSSDRLTDDEYCKITTYIKRFNERFCPDCEKMVAEDRELIDRLSKSPDRSVFTVPTDSNDDHFILLPQRPDGTGPTVSTITANGVDRLVVKIFLPIWNRLKRL